MTDNASGLVAVHATREYYAGKIAELEAAIQRVRELHVAVAHITVNEGRWGLCTCDKPWPCPTSLALDGLDPMLGDGAMLQAASQAVQEFVEAEPGDERFTCLDGTHEPACTCGASDPDDARDAARDRAIDEDF